MDDQQQTEWLGDTYKLILSSEDSGGAMSIIESTAMEGSGPPRHIHDAEDECFIILSGRCLFWMEGETFERGAGDTVFIPRGKEHTFKVLEGPSRMLILFTPGGFEGFFADMVRGQFAIPADMGAIEESAKRHNLRFTGPPLGEG